MDLQATKRLIEELSRLYIEREMTGRAYSRAVESLIALSGLEEEDPELEELAQMLASYSPSGGEGLLDDDELRDRITRSLEGFPSLR